VARRLLERAGYRVIEASGGRAALDVARDTGVTVDLLLTDMVMPEMHGRELMTRFRALRPAVPIVCMTGFADESATDPAFAALGATMLTKPFSSDALFAALQAACERGLQRA
jgi:CheY-like chemotaxis protein